MSRRALFPMLEWRLPPVISFFLHYCLYIYLFIYYYYYYYSIIFLMQRWLRPRSSWLAAAPNWYSSASLSHSLFFFLIAAVLILFYLWSRSWESPVYRYFKKILLLARCEHSIHINATIQFFTLGYQRFHHKFELTAGSTTRTGQTARYHPYVQKMIRLGLRLRSMHISVWSNKVVKQK